MAKVIDATQYGSLWYLHYWVALPQWRVEELLADLPVNVRANWDVNPKCPDSKCLTKVVMGDNWTENIKGIKEEVYRRLVEA